ncbi:hypothetical protein HDU96_009260 [Phlyctochytrium bullatum]|nr:hypothetical protein HDU96_009260 [Phlyctochytrium bullatum]
MHAFAVIALSAATVLGRCVVAVPPPLMARDTSADVSWNCNTNHLGTTTYAAAFCTIDTLGQNIVCSDGQKIQYGTLSQLPASYSPTGLYLDFSHRILQATGSNGPIRTDVLWMSSATSVNMFATCIKLGCPTGTGVPTVEKVWLNETAVCCTEGNGLGCDVLMEYASTLQVAPQQAAWLASMQPAGSGAQRYWQMVAQQASGPGRR